MGGLVEDWNRNALLQIPGPQELHNCGGHKKTLDLIVETPMAGGIFQDWVGWMSSALQVRAIRA